MPVPVTVRAGCLAEEAAGSVLALPPRAQGNTNWVPVALVTGCCRGVLASLRSSGLRKPTGTCCSSGSGTGAGRLQGSHEEGAALSSSAGLVGVAERDKDAALPTAWTRTLARLVPGWRVRGKLENRRQGEGWLARQAVGGCPWQAAILLQSGNSAGKRPAWSWWGETNGVD